MGNRRRGTRLVFIYGPPAVGKLTVAYALARITGFKLFHNHLTVDLVQSIFDWGEGPFWELVHRYRLELLEAAARAKIPGVVFTFVYAKPDDDGFVRHVVETVEQHGGEVCFVRLACDRDELFQRLRDPSRKAFRKMKRVTMLRDLLNRYELFADVPYANNLVIDNTNLSPRKAAQLIKRHFAF